MAAILACSGSDAPRSTGTVLEDPSGGSRAVGVGGEGWVGRSVEHLILDDVEPQPHAMTSVLEGMAPERRLGLAVSPEGVLHVVVRNEGLVQVIDAGGDVPRELRVDATGPVTEIGRIGWLDGVLWAVDTRNSRISFADRGTAFNRVAEVRLPGRSGSISSLRIAGVLDGERLLVETTAPMNETVVGDGRLATMPWVSLSLSTSDSITEKPLWVTDRNGTVVETLLNLSTRNMSALIVRPLDAPVQSTDSLSSALPGVLARAQPFEDFPLLAVDATGRVLVIVDRHVGELPDSTFMVHMLSSSGDTLASTSYGFRPKLVKDAWLRSQVTEAARSLRIDLALAELAVRQALFLPPWLPPVSQVFVDPRGWVWLRRELGPETETVRWDILDPQGLHAGAIELLLTVSIRTVFGLDAWAVQPDDEGRSVVLRISAPALSQSSGASNPRD